MTTPYSQLHQTCLSISLSPLVNTQRGREGRKEIQTFFKEKKLCIVIKG
jgi:hypothetical protein